MTGNADFASAIEPSLTGTTEEVESAIAELRSITTLVQCDHEQRCGEDDSTRIGWVEAGVVLKYVISASGQRRILDLLMPGDFFGFSEASNLVCALQAVTDGTCVARCQRNRMLALASRNSAIDQLLHERSHQAIARLESHLLVQGRTRSPEKVGAYLITMAKRLGSPVAAIDLPISRYDIADHLGIAVETVCRAITDLRQAGVIKFKTPRKIAILDAKRFSEEV